MLSSMLCMLFKYAMYVYINVSEDNQTTAHIKSVDASLFYNFDC